MPGAVECMMNGTKVFKSKLQFCPLPLVLRPDLCCQPLSPNKTAWCWSSGLSQSEAGAGYLVHYHNFYCKLWLININLSVKKNHISELHIPNVPQLSQPNILNILLSQIRSSASFHSPFSSSSLLRQHHDWNPHKPLLSLDNWLSVALSEKNEDIPKIIASLLLFDSSFIAS